MVNTSYHNAFTVTDLFDLHTWFIAFHRRRPFSLAHIYIIHIGGIYYILMEYSGFRVIDALQDR